MREHVPRDFRSRCPLKLLLLLDVHYEADDKFASWLDIPQVSLAANATQNVEAMRRLGDNQHTGWDAGIAKLVVERSQLRRFPGLVVVADHLERRGPVCHVVEESTWTIASVTDNFSDFWEVMSGAEEGVAY